MKVYVQKEKTYNNLGKSYSAEIVRFPVEVNGEIVDNLSVEYPLLNFRNITYFPMTYDYMANEFSSGYKWDNELGLMVSADVNLDVSIPEPHKVSLKVDHEVLKEQGILSEQMIHVEYNGEYEEISIKNGLNHNYDGYYYDVHLSHFNSKDELIYKELLMNGYIYESFDGDESYESVHGIRSDPMVTEAYYILDLELLPIPVARAEFQKNYQSVSFTYFDEMTLSYSDLQYKDAIYMEASLLPGSFNVLPDDLIPFTAAKGTEAYSRNGLDYDVMVYGTDDGEVMFEPYHKKFKKIKSFDRAYVDPREMNWGLKIYKGNALVDKLQKGYIKLYDKDYNLVKVMINKAEVDERKGN